MKATAKLRHLRMAPRKVRLAADLIRGKKVQEAQRALGFATKHSALPVLKTLRSAVASAKNNFGAVESNLYVSHIAVNEGPKLKRFRPRARGMAYEIQKKTSHITIEVDEVEEKKAPSKKKAAKTPQGAVKQEAASARKKPEEQKTAKKSPVSRPAFRPEQETQRPKKEQRGIQRFFRRKSI
jgi:large subunit ribosomal protein L22